MALESLTLLAVFAPLAGAVLAGMAGLWDPQRGRIPAAGFAVASVAVSLLASAWAAASVFGGETANFNLYSWARVGDVNIAVGFLVDNLSALMMLTVTFVSLMVHVYTIGYMRDDAGFCRFFAYIALFTFAMMMLVTANNFMQLFFGWEAVGLVSYLLIGFWFTRPSAIYANLKAFLVNRVGDLGFILGIGLVLAAFGSLDYAEVFGRALSADASEFALSALPLGWDAATAICILLFVGAMGKSAQFPLHVWLPDSMEGPTPISALIHAATMVTAGVFMVARMSPLFELSEAALTFVLLIGTVTAFFMGLLGLVQNDIKRVVAYSTLSQLGYMTAALGASAYGAAMFHLFTHAFFKALLFLAAGSVIIGMHHEQDMRRMGGLRKHMPLTYWTALLGSLALCGVPPFSGFYSKDLIIEAAGASELPGAGFAYALLTAGAFVTGLYSFRLLFLTFHGGERMSAEAKSHLHESPWVVTGPLILLAVPSVFAGLFLLDPMLGGDFFAGSIHVSEGRDTAGLALEKVGGDAWSMTMHGVLSPALWLALAGIGFAWWLHAGWPHRSAVFALWAGPLRTALVRKYGLDDFNDWFFAGGARRLGGFLWGRVDAGLVDGFFVNGFARVVGGFSRALRVLQTGRVYHYAFTMLAGVALALVLWSRAG